MSSQKSITAYFSPARRTNTQQNTVSSTSTQLSASVDSNEHSTTPSALIQKKESTTQGKKPNIHKQPEKKKDDDTDNPSKYDNDYVHYPFYPFNYSLPGYWNTVISMLNRRCASIHDFNVSISLFLFISLFILGIDLSSLRTVFTFRTHIYDAHST